MPREEITLGRSESSEAPDHQIATAKKIMQIRSGSPVNVLSRSEEKKSLELANPILKALRCKPII